MLNALPETTMTKEPHKMKPVVLYCVFVLAIGSSGLMFIKHKSEELRRLNRPDFEEIWKKRSMPVNWHFGKMPTF